MKRKELGFTLIEIMIATLLLSAVMYIGSMSFSIFSDKWQHGQTAFDNVSKQSRSLLLLRQIIQGTSNYLLRDKNGNIDYFFEGGSKSVSFVTTQGLLSKDQLSLVELKIIPADDNLTDELWYFETPLAKSPWLNRTSAPLPSFKIKAFRAQNIRFNYFGWQSKQDIELFYDGDQVAPKWENSYSSIKSGRLPIALNLSWANDEPILFTIPGDDGYLMAFTHEKYNLD